MDSPASNPTISASSGHSLICEGESATLTVNGASSYTWNSFNIGSSFVVSPIGNTEYVVIGKNNFGCADTTSLIQNVSNCTGIIEIMSLVGGFKLYPNPSHDVLTVELQRFVFAEIFDLTGKKIRQYYLEPGKTEIYINDLDKGMYFIRTEESTAKFIIKN